MTLIYKSCRICRIGNALTIGDIPAGQHKAIWVKRIVGSGAAAYNADSVVIKVQGDTAA